MMQPSPAVPGDSPSPAAANPAPADDPFAGIDAEGFLAEIRALRRKLEADLGEEDLRHLRKMERWGRAATAIGLLTAWAGPNPVSAIGLSLGRSTRWLLMHHVGHRGYDKVPGVPPRYTSKVFARGKRRFLDWPDWMIPEAWIYEHNVLHHANTGEEADPDLVERNSEYLRASGLPKALRYAAVAALGATWRASYYAPNTLEQWRNRGKDRRDEEQGSRLGYLADLLGRCYLPYAALNFGLLPALFLPLGPLAAGSALVNSILAEALTNLHTFIMVGPNHTGDDLYRFDDRPASRAEHYVRQVLGSVNFHTGGDVLDYVHLFLNYQIEHHLFPDLPMKKYQEAQPEVRAICAKYGVPYVQESVLRRLGKLVAVMVGDAQMRRAASPAHAAS